MAGGYSITISAVDRVSGTIDAVNRKFAKFSAPVNRLQASVAKFGQVSGLNRVGKAFGDISHAAGEAFQKVGQIVAPLGAISGAASVAGMYRLVSAWSEFGSKLGNSAQRIGISADSLQSLQGAARLAGSSAGSLTSGMQTLGQTMYDAIGGRAPEAAVMFRTLGVAFSDGAGHARSVTAVLPELADKIAALKDPYAQAQAATALFGGAAEDLLPFLRRGARGIAEYQEASRKYGHTTEAGVAAANQFRVAQASLGLSVEGLGNRIAERLAPVISPMLMQLADWIATSPKVQQGVDALATGAQSLGEWLKSIDWAAVGAGAQHFADAAQGVVDKVGGWQPAIELFLGFMAARWALGAVAPFLSLGSAIGGVGVKLALLALNPVGAIVAGIALLGVAGYELWQHWDAVETSFSGMWAGVKSAFDNNTGYLRSAVEGFSLLPKLIIDHWDGIENFFTDMWSGVKSAFDDGWSYIQPIIDKLKGGVDFVANSWLGKKLGYVASEVGAGVSAAAGAVSGAASSAVQAAPALLQRGVAALDTAWGFAETNPGARGIRNNNPLNLGYVPGQQGAVGSDGRFGRYGSMADGIAASERQLLRYQAQGTDTIAKMITRWAPASENETGSYISQVSKWSGIDPNAKVDMHDPATAQKIIGAMARRESGGVSASEVQMGVGLALGGVAAGPAVPAVPVVRAPVVAMGAPAQLAAGGLPGNSGAGTTASDGVMTVRLEHATPPPAGFRASVRDTGGSMAGANIEQANVMGTLP